MDSAKARKWEVEDIAWEESKYRKVIGDWKVEVHYFEEYYYVAMARFSKILL